MKRQKVHSFKISLFHADMSIRFPVMGSENDYPKITKIRLFWVYVFNVLYLGYLSEDPTLYES